MTAALFLLDAGRLTGATPGQTIVVDGAEGRHAATVKRIEPGEPVLLADGSGVVVARDAGLEVDEDTGAVKSTTGETISGLYAAGRTAVGICANSYVSGLSLADCVFSGRRAGRHAATA